MTDAQRAVAAAIAAGPRGSVRGPFVALLHNPELAQRVQALGEYLRFGTALPAPLLELAIITVARHWSCDYEWYAHEKLARKAGLAPAIIEAIAAGATPGSLADDQALVYGFCRETLEAGAPSASSYEGAVEAFGREGVLDLVALCGYYTLLALVLNTARPQVPADGGTPLAALAR